ncbi:MAG: Mycothione reductase [Chlamydiia bacterium]|nr:Mycothione reductase [Chlamydiia bacterium]MCH9615476.1 Mycothione reductase [Chlamydiia bacterium]MCH9629131.1 Mycothione reductase [Chlamydiia bacterium]
MKKYDVIVVGTGSGTKLVRPVAALGHKVAVFEMDKLGGTCLNHGCIPSKMLIHTADVLMQIKNAAKFNITVPEGVTVDFKAVVDRVCNTIDADSDSIAPIYEKDPNIDLFRAPAKFVDTKTLRCQGEEYTADKIFLAVGGRPTIPNLKGLKGTPFMTYLEALRNTKQPKKMIVIGGGFIALELGYFYAAMGTEVEFLVRERILRPEDDDIVEEFEKAFPFTIKKGWVPEEVSHANDTFTLKCNNGTLEADSLFVAAGMTPYTDILSLDKTGVNTSKKGYIEVDDQFKTSREGIWAFGDCIGRHFFRHSANYEGEYLFNTLYGGMPEGAIEYPPMPHAVFTNPQIGGVGKTELQLKKEGAPYVVSKHPYRSSGMGGALLADHGFVKLIFDPTSRKLIGSHIIGEEASNMIHMCIAYMNMGATVDDMRDTIYIHPALPEVVRAAARKADL